MYILLLIFYGIFMLSFFMYVFFRFCYFVNLEIKIFFIMYFYIRGWKYVCLYVFICVYLSWKYLIIYFLVVYLFYKILYGVCYWLIGVLVYCLGLFLIWYLYLFMSSWIIESDIILVWVSRFRLEVKLVIRF